MDKIHLNWVAKKRGKKSKIHWDKLVFLPAWVFVSFLGSIIVVNLLVWVLALVGIDVEESVRPAVYNMVTALVVYALALAIAISVPLKLLKQKTTLQELGLSRLLSWSDIGLAPLTFIAYTLILTTVMGIVVAVFPEFPADQAQDTGFNLFGSRMDNAIAFLTLVVFAPIAEEVLFRGYLYGKLKLYVPAFWGAVVTSLLFAIVHFQWNVGVDVFILSMFLCGLRSLTGGVWAGILTHMLKNAVAYLILINPLLF